ncbi:vacuolar protein sorting-associated protein 13C isoform X3 [Fundulus heteroclitus]|uniref:vacuolar protein sorting-associated protein 13C isoform X3 n=1 Tax=Fundulus heteroclitus TaxID=8078 RepID=UPI00165B22D9|nr:vacuolar protein sorting-associated protein 13C isoform X3 [Fundulus heteroclitus]
MVFESVVSDLLNRFIGDYVENLDKSQLKIGIWGGNVVLENLKVKENALSEFDVPFKVKAGQIGKLTLKIPWKNLYNDAVVATLEGLYLLVVPGATQSHMKSSPYNAIKYDAAREERYQQEAKQRELQRIEEALQTAGRRASQTGDLLFGLESVVYKEQINVPKGRKKNKKHKKALKKLKRHENKTDKPQEEKKDTFMEKLATQVIKNLQVKISSIHLRYEDDLSDPQRPLSMGVTLSELSLQTTDENWKLCILNEAAKIIYKLGRLESLCAYWNVCSPMYYKGSWKDIVDQLKSEISSKDQQLPHYQYIFKPIFASAKMCINPNAEIELKSPKANLQLEVQNIGIEMTKPQYLSMVDVLESIDLMAKNAPYRKFRPDVSVHDNPKVWWRYGFNSIMEVHIRRVSHMWSWSKIRQHRESLRAYKTAYQSKLLNQNKSSPDTERQIQDLEKSLDVFNITLARQQAQMEVIRSGQKLAGKKAAGQKQGGGFFSGWFGRKAKKEEQEEENKEPESSGLDQIMTAEEKEKLYTAIGYSGSSHNLTLPKQYVAVVLTFQLLKTSVTIREDHDVPEILNIQMVNLSTRISQRPGAQAVRVEAELEHWYVTGLQQQGSVPSLIASVGDSSSSLLTVVFELNPEESPADQLLKIHSQPVEIIYDAVTVNSMVDFFKTGKGVDLEVLTSATLSKLEEIKEKTAAGLSHIIETRKVLDLKIDLKPSYLIIPKSGFYSSTSHLLIVDFGCFQLHSVDQSSLGSSSSSSLEEVMDRAYERYDVGLRRVQLLYSQSGDAWKTARLQSSSLQHILQPMDLTLHLAKCMVEKDARMPRFKLSGELPLVHVRISDQKIQKVLELVDSVPLPRMDSAPSTPTEKALPLSRVPPGNLDPAFLDTLETDSDEDASEKLTDEEHQRSALEELINIHFKFELKEVLLELTQQADQEKTMLAFNISQLGAEGKMRSFDLSITSYLRRVAVDYCDVPAGRSPLHLISSLQPQGSHLLKVEFVKADPTGPAFQTLFNNTEQMLKVEVSSLDFLLHTKALLAAISYLSSVAPSQLRAAPDQQTKKQVQKSERGRAVSKGGKDGGIFSFKLLARLGCFHVEVCDDRCSIADIRVQGINATVSVQAKETEVFACLKDIVVTDANPKTVHKKAVSIVGDEVFSFKLSLFPGATEGDGYSDVSKVDGKVTMSLGCIQIVYLHKFFMSLLASFSFQYPSADEMFVDNFQTAKEALSSATSQAAERAASSVRDLAQRSFRLSMDIRLKAPLVIIPQSSTSQNALLVDLGLITVENSFALQSGEGFPLPAVVEKMDIKLTQLKLCRKTPKLDFPPKDVEILQPINVDLLVTRNLAASWFSELPGLQVQGLLRSLSMSLGEEELGVLMKILVENIGEGSKDYSLAVKTQAATEKAKLAQDASLQSGCDGMLATTSKGPAEQDAIKVLVDFEVKQVLLCLKKHIKQEETPFLVFQLDQLGINAKVRKYDMSATTYIRHVSMKSLEFKDPGGGPLCLVSSSADSGAQLLKVEFCKADRNGPEFCTSYENTEQMIHVTFTSLDVVLHTEALLSAVNFLSSSLSSGSIPSAETDVRLKTEDKMTSARSNVPASPVDSQVVDLKVTMMLGAFNVLVCDQTCNMAEIQVRGLDSSLVIQGPQTHIWTRLQDVVVMDVDPRSVHKDAISIVGDEVFSFSMSLTPNATEGAGYEDTSRSDGRVKLTVGCIKVVYLHKFIMSLLNFSNNFQTAKEALSTATAQAAEKAASGVRDLAQRSFRLSMDVRVKAPLIIIPQSSTSHHALVMDLGLITVGNSFSLLPVEEGRLPAVVDNMDVQLSELQLSRTLLDSGSKESNMELLKPVNLHLNIRRNLSAAWYKKMAVVEVTGDLKPMKLELSQDDLRVILRIMTENLGEAAALDPSAPRQEVSLQVPAARGRPAGEPEKAAGSIDEHGDEGVEMVKFNFNVESLELVLYHDDPKQPQTELRHGQDLRLGELALRLMKASGKILNNGCMEVNTVLTACTLDDHRSGVDRVMSRMVGQKEENGHQAMIDVTFRQGPAERDLVAVLQKLYVCASVEFLMTVADFFLQALPQSPAAAPSDKLPLRQRAEPRAEAKAASALKTRVRAVIVDPEVAFVASLMKADAPALLASFQGDFNLLAEDGTQNMRANLRDLKVLACPFIGSRESEAVTTVLKPCSVTLETKTSPNQPLSGSVTVEEVVLKISPVILNTVMTITAGMTPKAQAEQRGESKTDVSDLWSIMNVYDCNFWFLGVDQAIEVTESYKEPDDSNRGEAFTAQIKVVQVTLESGLGHRTVPLLLAESSLNGVARNWSSLLQLKADMTLEVSYFNEVHAVWEPLIERVDSGRRRWNLELEVKNNPVMDKSPVHGDDFVLFPEPRTAINICSKDTLNITVSKCSLSVFQKLAEAFAKGTASAFDYNLKEKPPFTIKNALGIPIILQHSANLMPVGSMAHGKLHELATDQSMDLVHSVFESTIRGKLSALQRQESSLFNLTIVPTGYSEIANIAVDKPGRRLYNVRGPMLQEAESVLLQIDAAEGNKIITVRSPLQIINHFSEPFSILKYCSTSRNLQSVGTAEPEKEFNVDLDAYKCQLFVRPAGSLDGLYGPSSSCVAWKEQVHCSSDVQSMLQCPASDSNLLPLMVSTLAVPDDLQHISSHGEEDWNPAYIIHLHPVAVLCNLLPYTVNYIMENSANVYELQEGSTSDLLNARLSGEIMSLALIQYQGRGWHGHIQINRELPEFFAVCLTCDTDAAQTLDVSVHVTKTKSSFLLSLFSPYWIINKTSRVLQYKSEDGTFKHPAEYRDVALFSFKKSNLFTKSKLQLCISTSSWSDGFSLDTVGSYGCVRCPATNMDFLVGVSIQISSFNLTRIVTLTPFYTLVNRSSYELEVGELISLTSIRWHYITSSECLPLWPENTSKKLCVRVVGSSSNSQFFFFNRQDNGTLLSMDMCGGIIVDISVSNHSTVISFSDYYDGAAPALLINHTPWATISYRQSGSEVIHELKPCEAQRFVWDDPAGTRKLSWSCKNHSEELDLLKDEVSQFTYDGQAQIHWVSFLDGRQRVLLFTEDTGVVTKAKQSEELEQFDQELKVSLQNLGLSLVNNSSRQEIAYVGITSSGVVWEFRPKNRWKSFSQKNINLLEKTYQSQLSGKTEGGWIMLENSLEVNLNPAGMMMRQPHSCPVRRNFLSGIQVEFKQSLHQRSLRAQLHWMQVDNQLPGAVFPIVFHPVPPPKSIALDSEPKPFIDLSVITRFNQHSNVTQFKYFMALVQEMAVKIDQGFLDAVAAVFTPAANLQNNGQKSGLIERDLKRLQAEPTDASLSDGSGLSFFEHFHISPIKLHLSLSLGSSDGDSSQQNPITQSLSLLLKSLGATLTNVDDIIFKLAFFEVQYQFYSKEKLMWAVGRHYTEEFLKQMYVLVLGLDVLGNPFGMIRGLSEGVEAFFYEPIQGAVQGPEEFAEGFAIGVRSLLGSTVGGAAGMFSKITGSMGKGLAAMTMDKEYQQERREDMNRPTKDFRGSLAKGGKGLLKGVVGGVTGIVTKPVEGAKKEGAAGFFKGIGKGLVGVVARPTGGIVDMASSTFQGIQRAAEATEEVTKLRPVRLIKEDGIIRPYDETESQGFDLYQRSGIKHMEGEVFRNYCPYPGHRKSSIIVTNRRVFCVKELDLLGHLTTDWECLFENFHRPPAVTGSELKIYCKEIHKLKLQKNQESVRTLQLKDPNTAQKLHEAIWDAQDAQKQHHMVRQKSQRFLRLSKKQ